MHDFGEHLARIGKTVTAFKAEKEKHKADIVKLRDEYIREIEALKNTQAPKYERIKQLMISMGK